MPQIHPALSASRHFLPSLSSFIPAFRAHFSKFGGEGGTMAGTLSFQALKLYYARADPLHPAICICAFFSTFVYVTQQVTGNASQVDRLWTFLPVIYTIHFTFQEYISALIDPPSVPRFFSTFSPSSAKQLVLPRLALILILQIIWSSRLTFHAIRRGFFKKGEEDYRWPILREKLPRWAWELLALFFIAIAQNILLALTSLPQYLILTSAKHHFNSPANPASSLTRSDYILAGLCIVNLSIEMVADQQQWAFQNLKRGLDSHLKPIDETHRKELAGDPDVRRGFVTRGLWGLSRHPNFFCEQINWWIFWAYTLITFSHSFRGDLSSHLFNYAIISPILMSALFVASTRYTENVSSSKYPSYRAYQHRVGMFLPFPDTFLRAIYYRFIANKETRNAIESQVWGDSIKEKGQ